jgi:hypothetical protein
VSETSNPPWVLKFISGKYQGGEFALEEGEEYVVGRSSECDMVLVEDMVSRAHASLRVEDGDVILRDNNSTNGSFVNGERVTESRLNEGDRILFGTSIIKLLRGSSAKGISMEETARPARNAATTMSAAISNDAKAESSGGSRATVAGMMSGLLEEVPLPDLLQLFSTSRKTGILRVQGKREARIYLKEGQVIYVEIEDAPELPPLKAAYRVVTWTSGMFVLEPWEDRDFDETIEMSTEAMMMEAMRLLDELQAASSEITDISVSIQPASPMEPKLRNLAGDMLDTFQLILEHDTVEAVLNASEDEDAKVMERLDHLIQEKYVELGEE